MGSGNLIIKFDVLLGDGTFRVAGDSFPVGGFAQAGVFAFGQGPVDAVGQVVYRTVFGHIAVVQVVNHLRDASDVESYAGNAASHGFHDGVGQVLLQRRSDIQVDGIVDVHQFLFVADVVHQIDGEREQGGIFGSLLSEDHHAQCLAEVGIGLGQLLAGLDQVVDALFLVADLHRSEEQQFLVERQLAFLTGLLLVARFEQVGIDGIGNAGHRMSLGQYALSGEPFQPMAAGYKGKGSLGIDGFFPFEYLVRQVLFVPFQQQGAMVAVFLVAVTFSGMVTDAGKRPHVV